MAAAAVTGADRAAAALHWASDGRERALVLANLEVDTRTTRASVKTASKARAIVRRIPAPNCKVR